MADCSLCRHRAQLRVHAQTTQWHPRQAGWGGQGARNCFSDIYVHLSLVGCNIPFLNICHGQGWALAISLWPRRGHFWEVEGMELIVEDQDGDGGDGGDVEVWRYGGGGSGGDDGRGVELMVMMKVVVVIMMVIAMRIMVVVMLEWLMPDGSISSLSPDSHSQVPLCLAGLSHSKCPHRNPLPSLVSLCSTSASSCNFWPGEQPYEPTDTWVGCSRFSQDPSTFLIPYIQLITKSWWCGLLNLSRTFCLLSISPAPALPEATSLFPWPMETAFWQNSELHLALL